MIDSRPSIQEALREVNTAYQQLLRREEADGGTLEDDLLALLAAHLAMDAEGTLLLDDGSRLFIIPERGDRGGDTGRIGVVQRFQDGRPEMVHIVAA
jgi:hypothetical protein